MLRTSCFTVGLRPLLVVHQRRELFCATRIAFRVGTKKPSVTADVTASASPSDRGRGAEFGADAAPQLGASRVKISPESTVVRRPTIRRGAFGNRVDESDLLAADVNRTIKEGLKLNIEINPDPENIKQNPMRPVGQPSELGDSKNVFWEKRRLQPLNPHYVMSQYTGNKVVKRVRDGTTLFSARDKLSHSHRMTDDQVNKFADAYVSTKWYSFVWRTLRRFDLVRLKRYQFVAQFFAAFFFSGMLFVVYYVYFNEVNLFLQLEKRDQDDYRKVIYGIRMSELRDIGNEFFEKHDPLHVMSEKERATMLIEELRKRGYVDKDWELEKRKRNSLVAEPDFLHIFFWTCMYVGSVMGGGGLGFWQGLDM
jgi:hypothetical protein